MRFLTIGIGHCGGKIANDFKKTALDRRGIIVDACAINTDRADLATHRQIPESNKLLIGTGKGAARNWREGWRAANEARTNIRELIVKMLMPDTDIILLTLGEGGGSGSGIAPLVSEILGEVGRTCISIVTIPFEVEAANAKVNAAVGLDLLYRQEALKALICIDNDKITAHFPDKLLTDAYRSVNETAVETFLDLLELAHMPSRADRIDESELASIFDYAGFATLANYRANANLVENLSATLHHSWNGSLFAEVDPETATSAIFGVKGPSRLFTTVQVDSVRRTFRDVLSGRDVMLGVYPVEKTRWVSYVGILAGMDIPPRVRKLLEAAEEEDKKQREMLERRDKLKKEGLGVGFALESKKREGGPALTVDVESKRLERLKENASVQQVDVGPYLASITGILQEKTGRTYALQDLVDAIKDEAGIEDDLVILASIIQLQERGYLAEIRKNVFQVL